MSATTQFNVAVLAGTLHRPPYQKVLTSGDTVTTFDIRIKNEGPAAIVPVSWLSAPDSVMQWNPGDHLIASGQVRQQWYGPSSRFTDVRADRVQKVASPAAVRKAVANAMALLQAAAP